MQDPLAVETFLFTDIEGSTRLWDAMPDRMRVALASHDAIARAAIAAHRGVLVKMVGDGVYAVFEDPLDALRAAIELQLRLADPEATHGIPLRVRAGVHAGSVEHRDNDFFGGVINRAARIMHAAHGGQILLSDAIAVMVAKRLPEGATLRELGAVRLRDLSSAEHIHQLVHPLLRRDFPALRSMQAIPNNLPQQISTFGGRERQLDELAHLLRASRLVTLVGPGGIGKTRLSLHVSADALDDFPDGVWFVEFGALQDAGLVPQAVASVLGVQEDAGCPVIDALARHVRERRLLLVLDNCEHLVQACAEVAKRLLHAGAQLKVLASSRQNLNVAGETTYPVHGLAFAESTSSSRVVESEAALLFA